MRFTNISNDEKVSTWSELLDIGKMMAAATAAAQNAGGAGKNAPAISFPGMPGYKDPSEKNAVEFMTSLVKHEYLNGFKLPDMPS